MSQRIITVVLRVEDQKAAEAVWEAHKADSLLNGCHVDSIANGNPLDELDELRERWDMAQERLSEYDLARIEKDYEKWVRAKE